MEKKKVLSKILPAALIFILVVLFVVVISSCNRSKKTPIGELVDEKDYMKVQLADGKTYSVSKLDFYNRLRYVGYGAFEDELYGTIFKDEVDKIKADIEANKSDLTQSKYYDKLVYLVDKTVYKTTDKKEIEKFKEKDKARNIKTYLNAIESVGFKTDGTDNIYQLASFEYQTINLATREYARSVLLEEAGKLDGDHEITDKVIEDYFTEKANGKGNIEALIVFFSSENEANEALMQLNLKFVGNKIYRVIPTLAEADKDSNGTIEYSEYEDFYKDFDTTKSGVAALKDNEYLFELCRIYNYVYGSYRANLEMEIGGVDYLDSSIHAYNPLVANYTDAEYIAIKNLSVDDMKEQISAQDLGDFPSSPRIKYSYDTLYDIDTTLATALYTQYLFTDSEKPRYNNPKSTYANGNYLAFKLEDDYTASYKAIKSLVSLKKASTDSSYSEKSIKGFIEEIREAYRTKLIALDIYDDDAKVKAWALKLADEIKMLDVTGAEEILKNCTNEATSDKFWTQIFEEALTDEYIKTVTDDYIKDHCKILIYDELFEVQYMEKNKDYKKANKASKELVAEVKIYDDDNKLVKSNTLTVADMYARLERNYGPSQALELVTNQILKDKYYDQLTKKQLKEFEDEYNSVLSYFAQGNTADYGYSPSIGLTAFTKLYFKADNKEDAIFNMWAAAELKRIALFEQPTDTISTIFDDLKQLADQIYSEYVNFDFRAFMVYTDDDEDGKADDWANIDTTDPVLVARKAEVEELAMKLINLINNRTKMEYSGKSGDTAYNSLLSKYKSASRVSQHGDYLAGDTFPTGTLTSAEIDSYYFAAFKAKGIYVSQENTNLTEYSSLKSKDVEYQEQLQSIYKWLINNDTNRTNPYTFAVKVNLNDNFEHQGGSLDEITDVSQLFFYSQGYTTFYVVTSEEQPNYKFEVKDNANDDVTGKVYPYSTDKVNPFPLNEENEPFDNSANADTLYNKDKTVSKNQILVYIREYNDGVESLALSVVEAFEAYFEEEVLKPYISSEFQAYLNYKLVSDAIANGTVTMNAELSASLEAYVKTTSASVFGFEDSKLATLWFTLFN